MIRFNGLNDNHFEVYIRRNNIKKLALVAGVVNVSVTFTVINLSF